MRVKTVHLTDNDLNVELLFLVFFVMALGTALLIPRHLVPLFPCAFKHLTGLPCPTCGITRTALAFVDGEFLIALKTSVLFTLAGFASILYALYSLGVLVLRLPRVRVIFANRREFLTAAAALFFLVGLNWMLSIYHHL